MKEQYNKIPDEILDLLARKATQQLSGEESEKLENWIKSNQKLQNESKLFVEQFRKLYWLNLVKDINHDNIRKVYRKSFGKSEPVINKIYRVARYAAAILLIAGLGWIIYNQIENEPKPLDHVEEPQTKAEGVVLVLSDGNIITLDDPAFTHVIDQSGISIENTPGESLVYHASGSETLTSALNKLIIPVGLRYQLTLSDGTRVWVNSATEIEYPIVFGHGERMVKMNGEAYFEVDADNNRPFIIEVNGNKITVSGTAFNVLAYKDDAYLEVVLVEGSVKLTNKEGNSLAIKPGQKVRLDHQSQAMKVENVETRYYTSWRDGVLYFNKIKLSELAVKLQRWYDVDIIFSDEKSASLIFSGAMESNRNIGFLMKLIEESSEINYRFEGKTIYISWQGGSRD